MKKKKLTLNEEISQIKKMMGVINENDAFNDDGEPKMDYQQYKNYGEPSEPEYDDMNNDKPLNMKQDFINELFKNDIILETDDGHEYYVRCHGNEEIYITFYNDEEIKLYTNNEEKIVSYDDALQFLLKNKDIIYTPEEVEYEKNREYRDAAHDRYVRSMEGGGWN